MTTGTLQRTSDRSTLRFERRLEASPLRVWHALTANEDLARWFPTTIEGPREEGSRLRFTFPNDEAPPAEGELRIFEPTETFEFTWGGDILRWELSERDGGTALVLTDAFTDEGKAARDGAGWEYHLENLERILVGEPEVPFDPKRYESVFNEYARRFGPAASSESPPH